MKILEKYIIMKYICLKIILLKLKRMYFVGHQNIFYETQFYLKSCRLWQLRLTFCSIFGWRLSSSSTCQTVSCDSAPDHQLRLRCQECLCSTCVSSVLGTC